jgi:hypothetical protein
MRESSDLHSFAVAIESSGAVWQKEARDVGDVDGSSRPPGIFRCDFGWSVTSRVKSLAEVTLAEIRLPRSLAATKGKSVIAVEPLPRNVRYLQQNVINNRLANVEVHAVAVADKPGIMNALALDRQKKALGVVLYGNDAIGVSGDLR